MDLKSRAIMVVVLAAIFSLTALVIGQSNVQANDTRIIRIHTDFVDMKTMRIEPNNIWVRPGTAIVFSNWAGKDISITFKEGAKCDAATQAAVGFEYDAKTSCMITSQVIPNGGTASMQFTEAGTYDYEIETAGKQASEKGSITVRKKGAQ